MSHGVYDDIYPEVPEKQLPLNSDEKLSSKEAAKDENANAKMQPSRYDNVHMSNGSVQDRPIGNSYEEINFTVSLHQPRDSLGYAMEENDGYQTVTLQEVGKVRAAQSQNTTADDPDASGSQSTGYGNQDTLPIRAPRESIGFAMVENDCYERAAPQEILVKHYITDQPEQSEADAEDNESKQPTRESLGFAMVENDCYQRASPPDTNFNKDRASNVASDGAAFEASGNPEASDLTDATQPACKDEDSKSVYCLAKATDDSVDEWKWWFLWLWVCIILINDNIISHGQPLAYVIRSPKQPTQYVFSIENITSVFKSLIAYNFVFKKLDSLLACNWLDWIDGKLLFQTIVDRKYNICNVMLCYTVLLLISIKFVQSRLL